MPECPKPRRLTPAQRRAAVLLASSYDYIPPCRCETETVEGYLNGQMVTVRQNADPARCRLHNPAEGH